MGIKQQFKILFLFFFFSKTCKVFDSPHRIESTSASEVVGKVGTCTVLNVPRCEKTGLQGFRPGPTQTGLYSHRRWIEVLNFGFR